MRNDLVDELDAALMRPLFNLRNARAMLDARAPIWQPTLLEEIRADEQRRSAQTRYDNACKEIRSIVERFANKMRVEHIDGDALQEQVDSIMGRTPLNLSHEELE